MAGHSKWANIQHRKGRQDAKRSRIFSRLSREITVAAKIGSPNPEFNPRLRLAIQEARSNSMPRDRIDRAISKSSAADETAFEEFRYEGFGPGGVGIIVEVVTDNRNRAAGEIRSVFSKHGGNMGETGSVSFMFELAGCIVYPAGAMSEDEAFEAATEAQASDVQSSEEVHRIFCPFEDMHDVVGRLEKSAGEPHSAKPVWRPRNTVPVDGETAAKLLKLLDALEDCDDVQNIHANCDIDGETDG